MTRSGRPDLIASRVALIPDSTFPLYLITGEKNFLVDAGPSARAPSFLKKISRVLDEITGEKARPVDTLLLTHSHWDHTGGARFLQQRFGFEVRASETAVGLLKNPGVIRAIDRMNRNFKKMTGDDSPAGFGELEKLKPFAPFETIPLGGGRLEIRETPGHTRCSVSFFLLPERILFPGDAAGLMEPDGTLRPLYFSSYPHYERSLRSLLELEARVLALPHNRPVRGEERVRSFLEQSLRKTLETCQEIREYLSGDHDVDQTTRWIVDREFSRISFMGPRDILVSSLKSMVRSVSEDLPDNP